MSSKIYYKSGQWSADFITVVRVHKHSICPTDYTFCFSYRFLNFPVKNYKQNQFCFLTQVAIDGTFSFENTAMTRSHSFI